MVLEGFCDANWASDFDDRRSTSGFCVLLGQKLISWQSMKQYIVLRSSTKVEYKSLRHLVAEITWNTSLLTEEDVARPKLYIAWCDNLSTVLLSANLVQYVRTKHVELDLCFVKERVLQESLVIKHVLSNDQIVDIPTKAISSTKLFTQQTQSLASTHSESEGAISKDAKDG